MADRDTKTNAPVTEEAPSRYPECSVVPPGRQDVKYKEVAAIPAGKTAVIVLPTDVVKKEVDLPLNKVAVEIQPLDKK